MFKGEDRAYIDEQIEDELHSVTVSEILDDGFFFFWRRQVTDTDWKEVLDKWEDKCT